MGKTAQELGQEILAHVAKGPWVANESYVRQLLDAGAALEEKDKDGNTPFLLAALHGLPIVAKVLFDRGADINVVNNHGDGVLHFTLPDPPQGDDRSREDFLPIADLALANGVKVDTVNRMGQTPLIVAAKEGLYHYVRDILSRNPDLDQVDWEKKNALQHAQGNENFRKSAELIQQTCADRDARREREAAAQAVAELRQEVQAIVGVMESGTKTTTAPNTARFSRHALKKGLPHGA
ncbi:MAG TPA: ankyrin repeat domain-containing protein [Patescibacteria group bacterium]|nr:ankyrin repeat domain-containing protein [Patescibacteria group bacterium]